MGPLRTDDLRGDTMLGGSQPPRVTAVALDLVRLRRRCRRGGEGCVAKAARSSNLTDIPPRRMVRIADPQGGPDCLFKNSDGDPPTSPRAPEGDILWNELHTPDPTRALAFYEAVVGSPSLDRDGPAGTYHILSRRRHRGGRDPPYGRRTPIGYVCLRRRRRRHPRAQRNARCADPDWPVDIPGVGRFGVLQESNGRFLALMSPFPRQPHLKRIETPMQRSRRFNVNNQAEEA